MRDLIRSLRLSGTPVPVPWPSLARHLKPRTQSLMVVVAESGAGKSAWALEWALSLATPSLYISLDTSLSDHAIRVLARNLKKQTEEIEEGHDDDVELWATKWEPHLTGLPHQTRFCDLGLTAETIGELVVAEAEFWGEPPSLVIVDNLMNLIEKDETAGEYRRILGELLRIAKRENTLIVCLHHKRKKPAATAKKDQDIDEMTVPVHLQDSLFKVDQEAKYVLGLWRPEYDQMAVGILKNRMGPTWQTTLRVDLGRMQVKDREAA